MSKHAAAQRKSREVVAAAVSGRRAKLAPLLESCRLHSAVRVDADSGKGVIELDIPIGNTPASLALIIEHDNISFFSLESIEDSADRLALVIGDDQRKVRPIIAVE